MPRYQSSIIQDSSEEEDSDVIEVSSEDEIPHKATQSHDNKTFRQTTIESHFNFKPPASSSRAVKQVVTSPETIEVKLNLYLDRESILSFNI